MKHAGYGLLLVMLLSSCMVNIVFAQGVRRDAGGDASAAKAQFMLKQVAAERDALSIENAELQTQLEALSEQVALLQKKNKNLKKDLGSTDKSLERYKETDAALRDYIEKQKSRTEEIIEKFKAVVADLRSVEADKAQLQVNVATLDSEVKSCVKNNLALYEIGLELVEQYNGKSAWDSFAQREPITGLKKVEMENLIQDYEYRLKNEKYINMASSGQR